MTAATTHFWIFWFVKLIFIWTLLWWYVCVNIKYNTVLCKEIDVLRQSINRFPAWWIVCRAVVGWSFCTGCSELPNKSVAMSTRSSWATIASKWSRTGRRTGWPVRARSEAKSTVTSVGWEFPSERTEAAKWWAKRSDWCLERWTDWVECTCTPDSHRWTHWSKRPGRPEAVGEWKWTTWNSFFGRRFALFLGPKRPKLHCTFVCLVGWPSKCLRFHRNVDRQCYFGQVSFFRFSSNDLVIICSGWI